MNRVLSQIVNDQGGPGPIRRFPRGNRFRRGTGPDEYPLHDDLLRQTRGMVPHFHVHPFGPSPCRETPVGALEGGL